MAQQPQSSLEARTQEIGRALHAAWADERLSPAEARQDLLMRRLTSRPALLEAVVAFVSEFGTVPPGAAGDRELVRLAEATLSGAAADLHHVAWPGGPARSRLVGGGFRLATRLGRWLPGIYARTARRTVRAAGRQLVVEDAPGAVEKVLARLRAESRYCTFDVPVEYAGSPAAADLNRGRYLSVIERLAAAQPAAGRTPGGVHALQVSIKLSAVTDGFDSADRTAVAHALYRPLAELSEAARAADVGLTWDMEEHRHRELTWTLFQRIYGKGALADWDGPGLVVQAYLRDSLQFARRVIAFAKSRAAPLQVRLVKGAYWDGEQKRARETGGQVPVFLRQDETDCHFESLARLLVADHASIRLAVAGHNLRSHAAADAAREALGLPVHSVEHQTLYGMAPAVSRAFGAMGWSARDYVPVGEMVPAMAYFSRRIRENGSSTSILAQMREGKPVEVLLRAPCANAPLVEDAVRAVLKADRRA